MWLRPVPSRRTQDELTLLIDFHLRAQGVELLILDEVNHLADTKTNQGRFLAADMIKEFCNFNSCQIVIVGMPSAISLLDRNLQLDRWSRLKHEVVPYDWSSAGDREDYEDFLEAFADGMRFRRRPLLSDWSEALSVASSGLVGITSLFIVRANGIAMTAGDGELRLDHLAVAFDELKPRGTRGNPFVSLKSVRFPKNYTKLLMEGFLEKTNLRRRRTATADEAAE